MPANRAKKFIAVRNKKIGKMNLFLLKKEVILITWDYFTFAMESK